MIKLKKLLVVILLMGAGAPCLACTRQIHSYPEQGIYYYQSFFLRPQKFKLPAQITPADGRFYVFIYDRYVSKRKFEKFEGVAIEKGWGGFYEMLSAGVAQRPKFYVTGNVDELNQLSVTMVKINRNNTQVQYERNSQGQFVLK